MAARKGGGSKLKRSQTVGVRLDPKLRYLAELAARKQRRTLSSYIEWAIENSLKTITITDKSQENKEESLDALKNNLWDVDEPDRVVRLALRCPDLLSFDEQIQWKIICEAFSPVGCRHFWNGDKGITEEGMHWYEIRERWDDIKKYASNELSKEQFETILAEPPF